MSVSNRQLLALAGCLLLVVASAPAAAYERTQTCSSYGTTACDPDEVPKPIEWPVRCVRYRINQAGTSDFPSASDGKIGEALHGLIRRAFETWNAPTCTDFTLVEGELTSKTASYDEEAGLEGNTNVIEFHDEEWPHASLREAFALTSVSFKDNGWIEDADIEINSATYEFAHFSESKTDEMTAKVDLANTLTHEVGHFVGLAHAEAPEATMYGVAPLGETRKRTLHRDDIDGLCAIYPDKKRDGPCDEPADFRRPLTPGEEAATEPTCSTTGRRPTPGFVAFVCACLFVFTRRHQRRA